MDRMKRAKGEAPACCFRGLCLALFISNPIPGKNLQTKKHLAAAFTAGLLFFVSFGPMVVVSARVVDDWTARSLPDAEIAWGSKPVFFYSDSTGTFTYCAVTGLVWKVKLRARKGGEETGYFTTDAENNGQLVVGKKKKRATASRRP